MVRYSLHLLAFLLFLSNCGNIDKADTANRPLHLIPLPAELQLGEGYFSIDANTSVSYDQLKPLARLAVQSFLEEIKTKSGLDLSQNSGSGKKSISFALTDDIKHKEGYLLKVTPNNIQVSAAKANGIFYAIQTLRQLLPPEFTQKDSTTDVDLSIPVIDIKDEPRFPYRGMHLDVARHFSDVATVKKFIDQMAYHKLNHFHWHLTEDQGWRIEIKQFPKLTEVGAYRNGTLVGHYSDQPHQFDGQRYGGFYTQEEVREVITYAAERFITVVPEIEMPGHAQAALAAYPELACTEGPFEVWQKWGVSEDVFCPTETTFSFLEKVLDEVIALFPGKYIHIGGDECPKTRWKESAFCQQLMKKEGLKDEHELQSYFIRRIEQYINSKGKQIIGWDEILEGGLAPNATVMSWRGVEGGIEAAKSKHDVIMTPTSHCYLDYYQSDHPDEPLAIGGFLPLEKVYSYDPIPEELSAEERKYILGAQANIWTEYMKTAEQREYMAFPRLCALAEVVWSPQESRNFERFVKRLVPHIHALELMGVKTANHLYELASDIQVDQNQVKIDLSTLAKDAEIRYTLDGSGPGVGGLLYTEPIVVNSSTLVKAQSFLEGEPKGRPWVQQIDWHLATGKHITLNTEPHEKYSANGPSSIINGILGSNERYGDAEWLGFAEKDFDAILDLGQTTSINKVSLRFYKGEGQWIYLPESIEISGSDDGENFQTLVSTEVISTDQKVAEVDLLLDSASMRYLKIYAKNYGTIPKGKQGAGYGAWLFVDEVRVY